MSLSPLDELAQRHGVSLSHHVFEGETQVSEETKRRVLSGLGLDVSSEAAIRQHLAEAADLQPPRLAPVPDARCFVPDWLENGRCWGVSVQVYELRSRRNWGIGDFADLAEICRIAAAAGAEFVGTNPLHALFLAEPERCSPFSPSNRLFLNPLYIAVDRLPGPAPEAAELAEAGELRGGDVVDYPRVAALKLRALRRIFAAWKEGEQPGLARADFDAFLRRHGTALERHALFEALSAEMVRSGHGSGWRSWPEEFHDVEGPAVREFLVGHREDVEFHCWLQWIADLQLAEAADAARRAGMRIGLYLDFAVGETPDSSGSWADPALSVPGVNIGAPPDVFTASGQDWGLTPLSPLGMARTGFAGYRATIEALMRHSGALRIDHAMSLWQLFFVPEGGVPADGCYVRYPIDRLLAILAEQSQEHRTLVIGEDLGHVPPGFREVMQASRILSYRILYFEKRDDRFIPPEGYPALALACLSTHDLPTMRGWWIGDDIELRLEHGLIEAEAAESQRRERAGERRALVELMVEAGVLPEAEQSAVLAAARQPSADLPTSLVVGAHRLVARTPCLLAGVRLADLTGESRPTNLPGTVDSYPNWRLKSSLPIEDLAGSPLFEAITGAVAAERPRTS